jgi:hypothetical protein
VKANAAHLDGAIVRSMMGTGPRTGGAPLVRGFQNPAASIHRGGGVHASHLAVKTSPAYGATRCATFGLRREGPIPEVRTVRYTGGGGVADGQTIKFASPLWAFLRHIGGQPCVLLLLSLPM